MTVRVALIGAGVMGADHAGIFAGDVPGAMLKVICDASEATARPVADATSAEHVRGELVGTDGSLSLSAPSTSRVDRNLLSVKNYPADWRLRFREAYRLQHKAWINSINSGRTSWQAASAWVGYCAAAVAEAAPRQ